MEFGFGVKSFDLDSIKYISGLNMYVLLMLGVHNSEVGLCYWDLGSYGLLIVSWSSWWRVLIISCYNNLWVLVEC